MNLENKIVDQIWDQYYSQIRIKIYRQIVYLDEQIYSQYTGQVWEQVRGQIMRQTYDQLEDDFQ